MQHFTHVLHDEHGFHMRPAKDLCTLAKKFASTITISFREKNADAKRLIAVMSLGAKCNDCITLSFDGSDEVQAANALQKFLCENL